MTWRCNLSLRWPAQKINFQCSIHIERNAWTILSPRSLFITVEMNSIPSVISVKLTISLPGDDEASPALSSNNNQELESTFTKLQRNFSVTFSVESKVKKRPFIWEL